MATSRGSSVHFRPLHSPMLCEAHNRRAVNPQYLLPEKDREPNIVVRDGDVAQAYAQKMALASGRARATPKYSPLKEGIANLADEAPEVLHAKMERWCQEYEAITGERVVACVIHRDEGYIASDGIARRNVHAHVVVDRTDRRGRVVNSIPDGKGGTRRTTITDRKAQGRRVQDMTARITGLERGADARETKRRHIDHHSYRALARQNRLRDVEREDTLRRERDASHAVAVDAIRDRETAKAAHAQALAVLREMGAQYGVTIERGTKAEYAGLREAMKASGTAQQTEYQRLKGAFAAVKAERDNARRERDEARAERDTWRRRAAEQAERAHAASEGAEGAEGADEITDDEIAHERVVLERHARANGTSLRDRERIEAVYDQVRERWKTANAIASAADRPKLHTQRDYSALRAAQQQMQTKIANRRADREHSKRRWDRRRHAAREAAQDGFSIGGERVRPGYHSAELAAARELGLRYDWDAEARVRRYRDRTGTELFTATRRMISMVQHDEAAEVAAVRLGAAKWSGRVSIQGSAEFRERMARLATREGIRVVDADLARIVEDERSRRARGEQVSTPSAVSAPPHSHTRAHPTTAQLARWWNPKLWAERMRALDVAQRVGYERSVMGAWHAARDAAERKHAGISADQTERERSEGEEGLTRIPASAPEPDDEQDLGR